MVVSVVLVDLYRVLDLGVLVDHTTMVKKMDTIELAREFHSSFGLPDLPKPDLSNRAVCQLRLDLLTEELNELREGIEKSDPVEVLDALTDIQYVLDGTYLSLGFSHLKAQAYDEVHRSNMSKLDSKGKPIYREDGKILKGPNYFKPNLKQFLEEPSTCSSATSPSVPSCTTST